MIREVEEKDNDILINLYKEIFHQNISFNDEFSIKKVYIKDNKIIGFIDYSIIYERAELNYICVLDEYQKCGYASSLMEDMFKSLKQNNIENITLEVSKNNTKAIALYQKFGFNIESVRKNYYADGSDAYLMMKVI